MSRSHGTRRVASCETHGRMPVGLNDSGFKERGIHHLAFPGGFAGMQRSKNADAGQNSSGDIGNRRPYFYGRMAWAFSRYAHQTAHALRNQVESAAIGVRAGASEAG